MSNKYKYGDEHYAHFVTYTVVQWIDFFIRDEYRRIIVKAIKHYQKERRLDVYGYCIMSSHIHLIIRAGENDSLEDFTRDFKGYTPRWREHLARALKYQERPARDCLNEEEI